MKTPLLTRLPFCAIVASLFLATAAVALTGGDHPYTGIVDRNVFALKPPTPVTNGPVVPPSLPANVELRGITTLLGRPQVLLNLKVPARPPEPPKDRSLVMDIGQREGDVEVLEINAAAGSVRLRNQGTELAMNLKDNAAKPQFSGVPAAMPGVPAMPGVIPPPAGVPNNPAPNLNPAGAAPAVPAVPSLPTRNLRSTPTAGLGVPGTSGSTGAAAGGFNDASEQIAAIEVMRAKNKALIDAGKMAPPPVTGVSLEN